MEEFIVNVLCSIKKIYSVNDLKICVNVFNNINFNYLIIIYSGIYTIKIWLSRLRHNMSRVMSSSPLMLQLGNLIVQHIQDNHH